MDSPLSANTTLALMQISQNQSPDKVLSKNQERINESAKEFEAVFLSEMLKPMFEDIKVNELFGGGKGEEIFRGFMLQEYGKNIASLDMTGIQTQVKNKLIQLQSDRTAEQLSQKQGVIDLDVIEE